MIQDMCAVAYSRAHAIGRGRNQPKPEAITVPLPDISRTDNQTLAASANALMSAFASMTNALGSSPTLNRAIIEQAFEFAGTPLDPDELDRILAEQEAEKRKTQAQQQQQKPEPAAAAPMPIVVKQNGH
jgi:DNA-binding NtrC family response regulator